MSVRELGRKLREGATSCVQLVEQALREADEKAHLNAFITLTAGRARAAAADLDRELQSGIDRGPLHGIPIALKDLFYTRGVRTTGGSLLFQDFVPDFEGDVVKRLEQAGAVSIGKANLHELAFGITSLNPHFGHVANPLDTSRLAGGSSGGSAAAVAAGIVPLALGTDTGGSIRIPASFCGLAGLKPTYGVVSRRGVLPLAFSLDHVGPLARCVEDCALAMNAMADKQVNFNLPELPDLRGVRIGVPRRFFFDRLDETVEDAVTQTLELCRRHDATILDVTMPDFEAVNLTARVIQLVEVAALHVSHTSADRFGPDVWSLVEQGRQISGHEYVNAQRLRTQFCSQMNAVWATADFLIVPATPTAAPPCAAQTITIRGVDENVRMASTRLVRGFNLLGVPVLSLPCGRTPEGLPVGLQLVGQPFSDAGLLQLGKTLERLLERQT